MSGGGRRLVAADPRSSITPVRPGHSAGPHRADGHQLRLGPGEAAQAVRTATNSSCTSAGADCCADRR
ncbi:hypothetical protein [Streptomyces sp. HUAS TT20]|uniref:hypothetical protein n=1 Tax=Streptomyces sp. HUAS TT20 TaxID=3447509 RepID=UPI0021DB228E|nr:hypothetical protein [Streptomyces sp. HUAS 15-9]UXY31555.1 hypothetical protein N8I87_36770 [Streptomyces sp. HUAS 15-9]